MMTTKSDDLRRVRELQQERTDELARIAAQERKKKAEEERKRKNSVAKQREGRGGRRLGSGDQDSNTTTTTTQAFHNSRGSGYNPMQPWSAGTGGYRPARRSTGGG